jgi:hypothetical protein
VAWVEKAGEWQPVANAGFDHSKFAVYVWCSVRTDGDAKTEKSRRTLEIPNEAVVRVRCCTNPRLEDR